ncbi:MAG: hypothetical protein ACE5JL_12170, partial [Dehalococcoidia bacterium]
EHSDISELTPHIFDNSLSRLCSTSGTVQHNVYPVSCQAIEHLHETFHIFRRNAKEFGWHSWLLEVSGCVKHHITARIFSKAAERLTTQYVKSISAALFLQFLQRF